jgi:pyrroloquinoline quinone biosynthesis protein D
MSIEAKDIYKIAAHHRFQWEKAQDCYVILFPEGMVKLNGSAGEVLNLVNGESTVESITEVLSKKFIDAPNISKDIVGMIELALDKSWIEKVN